MPLSNGEHAHTSAMSDERWAHHPTLSASRNSGKRWIKMKENIHSLPGVITLSTFQLTKSVDERTCQSGISNAVASGDKSRPAYLLRHRTQQTRLVVR